MSSAGIVPHLPSWCRFLCFQFSLLSMENALPSSQLLLPIPSAAVQYRDPSSACVSSVAALEEQ